MLIILVTAKCLGDLLIFDLVSRLGWHFKATDSFRKFVPVNTSLKFKKFCLSSVWMLLPICSQHIFKLFHSFLRCSKILQESNKHFKFNCACFAPVCEIYCYLYRNS